MQACIWPVLAIPAQGLYTVYVHIPVYRPVHRACVHRLIPVYTGLYTVCRLNTGYAGLYTVYTHIQPVPLI